jgi:hypothetical protein
MLSTSATVLRAVGAGLPRLVTTHANQPLHIYNLLGAAVLPRQQRTLSFMSVALYLVLLLLLLAARAAAVAAASAPLPAADSSRARPAAFHAGRPPSSTATLHTAAASDTIRHNL